MDFYGTLGPSCRDEATIEALFRAGMTGARLNLSHGGLASHSALLESYRRAAARCGIAHPLLVLDMQGPELRIGDLPSPLPLTAGESIVLMPPEACPIGSVPLPRAALKALTPGQVITLDDSALQLRAEAPMGEGWLCRVERGGLLRSRKSAAMPGIDLALPTVSAADRENLALARFCGVTAILQPFVRNGKDLAEVRTALDSAGLYDVKVIAKIENLQGADHLDEIIAGCDEVCIARGDLGSNMPIWLLPKMQKAISARCRAAGKPFMVVTQMLHSMEQSPVPTRAEVSDIYNAVLDGASSLMLTGETAAGHYPAEAMTMLVKTANTAL